MPTLIFGKIFASMFEGSMYGAGAHVFAVMSYVISHMQPDKDREEYVRLNPKALADVIGEPEERMEAAIKFLTDKDPISGSPDDEGRRLVPTSPFVYRVVNGRYYRELKDEEDRLEKAAIRQARHRAKKAGKAVIVVSEQEAQTFETAKNGSYKRRKVVSDAGEKAGAKQVLAEELGGNCTVPMNQPVPQVDPAPVFDERILDDIAKADADEKIVVKHFQP